MFARLLLVASIVLLWCVTPVLAQSAQTVQRAVTSDQISVSISVYVTSVISTAIATWVVARYDRSREKKIDELERDLAWLHKQFADNRDSKD